MGARNLAIKFPPFLLHLLLHLIFFMSTLTCVGVAVEGGMLGAMFRKYYRIVFCGVFQSYWYRFLNVKTENKQKFEFLTGTMTNRELSHIIDSSL